MAGVGHKVIVALAALIALMVMLVGDAGAGSASASVAFVQGTSFDNASGAASVPATLSQPVNAGDLLVGWFAQWGSAGDVQVSDNVNGAWTRAPDTEQFGSSGDIALYYLAGSKAAAGGITITVSAAAGADFQGAVAEYSGVAASNAFGLMSVSSGNSTAVNSGATTPVAAGQLVYAAEVTGVSSGAPPTAGSSDGVPYTERESTAQGSAFEEDITAGAAGAQSGTATLAKSTDWYAVVATFVPASGSTSPAPSVPTGLATTSDTASSVGLSWTPSTGGATGYTVYRNGTALGTTTTTTYTDSTVAPSTTYQYTVDAYNSAGTHSAQSTVLPVTTPAAAAAPSVPTGLATTSDTASSVGLSWTPSTGGATGYTVYRNGTALGTTTTTTYTDSTVAPSTTYQYTVDAYNSGGTHSAQSTVLPVTTPAAAAAANVTWVQGASVSTGTQVTSTTLQLSKAVAAGDLLVGWFGQYSSSGQVQVSDSVNGAWTRASASTTFGSHGDLAIFYVQNSKAASSVTITISATTATYLQGAVSEFSGIATAGALDQSAATSGNSASVDSGATGPAGAGELVVGGIITGGQPGTVTPGSSQGQPFTMGTQTSAGSADLEYVLGSTAGTQDARATFSSATDWYAAVATFVPASGSTSPAPSVPTGLATTSDTASSVGLSWTPSTGGATGYTVYRNGTALGTTTTTTYTDSTVAPSTTYQYTVDAYNSGGTHSAQSTVLPVTTPAAAAAANVTWVQGASVSTGTQVTSTTLQLSKAVAAGDLLVGWFGQYSSSGQVQVSDSVNGAWTRASASTTFGSHGDLAIFYVQNSKAASSVTITISATTATYLQGAVSEFSGIATAGALDQSAATSGNSASVDSGATGPAGAGELVVGGIITGGQPGTVTPGSSQGQPFTMGTQTSAGSADLEYVLGSTAGTQDARATFSSATDWHAAVATFVPASVPPPSVPTGLATTSDTASSVGLRWTASTDHSGTLSGYTVYRNGNKIGTTGSTTTTYTDSTVAPSTPYQYSVDAFDTNGNHSAQSQALSVTTPATTNKSPIKKVLVIMDENQSSDDVFPAGSNPTAAMPYLWSLAQEYGYANDWSDIGHPSQPNYLAIFGGDDEGLPNDCAVGPGCEWPGPTVFSQAIAAGGTAKSYEEGMTSNCEPTTSGYYDFNHNPWVYYDDPTDETECAADDVPSGTPQSGALNSDIMSGALPTVGLLKPTLADDTTDGTFATADSWLESWISLIQTGPDWKSGNLAIVVTFDESDEDGGENVPFVLIAPSVSGAVVTPALNHYALTRFLDEVAGASLLGNADTEPDIAPLFGVTVSG